MTLAATPRTQTKADKRAKAEAAARRGEADDIVDRFIAEVRRTVTAVDADVLAALESRLRAEFGGAETYVRKPGIDAKVDELRRIFNGRNASECARILGVGRATVYRLIKTSGKVAA